MREGIQKLVPRYDKCLNNVGEYVEKFFEECSNLITLKCYMKHYSILFTAKRYLLSE